MRLVKKPQLISLLLAAIIGCAALIMSINSITHPPAAAYDYGNHLASIQANTSWQSFIPHWLPNEFSYNPILYYYLFGKLFRLTEILAGYTYEPYFFFRFLHLLFIVVVGSLYSFSLLPWLRISSPLRLWFCLALFTLPNLYLSQVMVRADHLLLLEIHVLFYLWFRFDFPGKLPSSRWRLLAWSLLLCAMANTRHFSAAAFILFLGWGVYVVIRHTYHQPEKYSRIFFGLLFTGIILVSGTQYLLRAVTTPADQWLYTGGNDASFELEKKRSRLPFFLNMQFDTLLAYPNRHAPFAGSVAFLPRLYGDMWADHWLYFSSPLLPGGPRRDDKVATKRLVLMIAAPFTALYVGFPMLRSIQAVKMMRRKRRLTYDQTAGLLFVGGLLLLAAFAYIDPRLPHNDSVKFTYIIAYAWFPFLCILPWLQKKPILATLFLAYTAFLYVVSLPLFLYVGQTFTAGGA